MKGFYLKPNELAELHAAHKLERNKRYAYRIHAVILLGTGYTLKKVRQVLFIDDETLRGYVGTYRTEGIPGLASDHRGGKEREILDELRVELEKMKHEMIQCCLSPPNIDQHSKL